MDKQKSVDKSKTEEIDVVMYGVEDVMHIFGIGRTRAYQLMSSSGFPAIRLNKKLLVSQKALEEFVRRNSGRTYNY